MFHNTNLIDRVKRRKPVQNTNILSAFHQTLGDEFTLKQDNNLKHKAKYTLELLTKKTGTFTELGSYSFDYGFELNLWQC